MESMESLSEQLKARQENRERTKFARQVDAEATDAERQSVIDFIEQRVGFLNSRGDVGDTFRADECLRLIRNLKAVQHRN